jgi:hypothetical protein
VEEAVAEELEEADEEADLDKNPAKVSLSVTIDGRAPLMLEDLCVVTLSCRSWQMYVLHFDSYFLATRTKEVAEWVCPEPRDCMLARHGECTSEWHEKVPKHLWEVRRRSGAVDEREEQSRAVQLRKRLPSLETGLGKRRRVFDTAGSWDGVRPTSNFKDTPEQIKARLEATPPKFTLDHEAWERLLAGHPDRLAVCLLLDMIRNGANLGYEGSRGPVQPPRNHPIGREEYKFINERISKDIALGRSYNWTTTPTFANNRFSPMGVVPKTDEKGAQTGWRLICDGSAPLGLSVNDGIDKMAMSVLSWEETLDAFVKAGRGAWFSVTDVESAFRLVEVREFDRPLLGLHLPGRADGRDFTTDRTLSFGLRTSPALWDRVGRMLIWIARKIGLTLERFVDDVAIFTPNSVDGERVAKSARLTFLRLAAVLRIPMSPKGFDATQCGIYTGVGFNTVRMELWIPPHKKERAVVLARAMLGADSATIRETMSLAGKLQHLTRVLPQGRVFLRGLYAMIARKVSEDLEERLVIDDVARQDLAWWIRCLPPWPGIGIIRSPHWSLASCEHVVFTDASTGWGWSAVHNGHWARARWVASEVTFASGKKRLSTTVLELFPILRAAATWGPSWRNGRVALVLDCQSLYWCLNKNDSKKPRVNRLLRVLANVAVEFNFEWRAFWIPTCANGCADALSRGVDVQEAVGKWNWLQAACTVTPGTATCYGENFETARRR